MKKEADKIIQHFNDDQAQDYDEKILRVIPGYEAMHEMVQAYLRAEVPKGGSILVVGSGTGQELCALAKQEQDWQLTGLRASLRHARAMP